MSRLASRVTRLEGGHDCEPFGIQYIARMELPDGADLPAIAITATGVCERGPNETEADFCTRVTTSHGRSLTLDDMTDDHIDDALFAVRARIDALHEFPELKVAYGAKSSEDT